MTLDASDPNRHPEAPPRSGSYEGLDAARQAAQRKVHAALSVRCPEPGIHAATVELPRSTIPDERLPGASPILCLPFEELIWNKTETEPKLVWRRFKVQIHGFD